jgi:hypothetical protein
MPQSKKLCFVITRETLCTQNEANAFSLWNNNLWCQGKYFRISDHDIVINTMMQWFILFLIWLACYRYKCMYWQYLLPWQDVSFQNLRKKSRRARKINSFYLSGCPHRLSLMNTAGNVFIINKGQSSWLNSTWHNHSERHSLTCLPFNFVLSIVLMVFSPHGSFKCTFASYE